MASSSTDGSSSALLSSILLPSQNSFECLSLPLTIQSPSLVRRTFLKLSLLVHPDKNPDARAKEAFQKISAAFEELYDEQSQRIHLVEILKRQRQPAEAKKGQKQKKQRDEATTTACNKKRKTNQYWKQKSNEKKTNPVWAKRRWEDVVAELRRREELEKKFVRKNSDERLEKKVKGLVWKAMKVCRTLDERAGCPPTFVNGLWAPLYEQEVLRSYALPEGWEIRWDHGTTEQPQRIYRNNQTGDKGDTHPNPNVESLIEKARKAELTNKFRFQDQPRLFLGEIVEYLREDHEYLDMGEDILELEEEEQAREDHNTSHHKKEYDY